MVDPLGTLNFMKTFISIILTACSLRAQQLPLADANWSLNYAYSNSEIKLSFQKSGGMSWTIPLSGANKSPGAPYVTGEWAGYLQFQHAHSIQTLPALTGAITIQGSVSTSSPSIVFNYNSESFNTCPNPASLHVYFEGINAEGVTWRYWNVNPILLAAGAFSWSGTMDSSQWADINGQSANMDAAHLADFDSSRSSNYFIGATHGGGCFYGHGVNTSGGTATVTITSFAVNQ